VTYVRNKEKDLANARKWREENPVAYLINKRRSHIRKYGLSIEDYAIMALLQDFSCAICGHRPEPRGKSNDRCLSVDHDHDTGRVRGLLCIQCNTALGMARDDPSILEAMARYLRQAA
jgi:hypothetical protein